MVTLQQPFALERVASEIVDEWLTKHNATICSRRPSTIAGSAIYVALLKIKNDRETGSKLYSNYSGIKEVDVDMPLSKIALASCVAEGTLKNFVSEMTAQ